MQGKKFWSNAEILDGDDYDRVWKLFVQDRAWYTDYQAKTDRRIPLVRRFAVKTGAIDRPSDRKVHPTPTPTLGGIAIYLGVLVGMAGLFVILLRFANSQEPRQ